MSAARAPRSARTSSARATDASLTPMLATAASAMPNGDAWVYEPKYDGIRVLGFATPQGAALVTRNGNRKTAQFPEIVEAIAGLARAHQRDLVLDGEIVALDRRGEAGRFQALQGRMHLQDPAEIARLSAAEPAALAVFDLLVDGKHILVHEPWTERRERLESLLDGTGADRLILTPNSADGDAMLERARRDGWEGIIAKRRDAGYRPGARSDAWRKVKVERRQEFVVGGWTEPRKSRKHLGALLLGYYDDAGDFIYAGHMGGGFTQAGLRAMYQRLRPLERETAPFAERPPTNEPAHWVHPEVVVEVKFNEWTADGKLRQPIFIGVRDDKPPGEVRREPTGPLEPPGEDPNTRKNPTPAKSRASKGAPRSRRSAVRRQASSATAARTKSSSRSRAGATAVLAQLEHLQEEGGGSLQFPNGTTLDVTSLDKIYFPGEQITKGDVMRYYARVATPLLAEIDGHPLGLKRYPDGIAGESFYQHRPSSEVPAGVRTASVSGGKAPDLRFIGGDLATLLYTVQLGAISVNPWLSRLDRLDEPVRCVLDLDPGPETPFARVVEVAALVHEELERIGLSAGVKTSGATGMHIVLPLPQRTSYAASVTAAEIIATHVAEAHPKIATVVRSLRARPKGTVYVDFGQNARGKTVAGVFAVRAKPGAQVSTPLDWKELTPKLRPDQFTIAISDTDLKRRAEIWTKAMRTKNDLGRLLGK